MGKHKKKKNSKKVADAVPDDVLDAAVVSIKKFRKITNEIAKLNTGQKLVGGLVLAAAGYFYLDQRKGSNGLLPKFEWPKLDEEKDTSATEQKDEVAATPFRSAVPRKSQKITKPGKTHGHAARKASDDADDV
jgi:hypothetical protein